MVNIAFVCDEKYFLPTKVAITSLISNKDEDDKVNIFVVCEGITHLQVKSIQLLQSEDVSISIIISERLSFDVDIEHLYVSKAALYKILLANMLPDISKVIYLDGDILVFKSLKELFNLEMGSMYVAAVKDMIAEKELHMNDVCGVENYFNSGVMLLNLKQLREDNVVEKLIADRIADTSWQFMDQNTFNRVFSGHVMILPPEYNYMYTNSKYPPEEMATYYDVSVQNMKNIIQKPAILHLTNLKKPWNSYDAGKQDIWLSYLSKEDIIEFTKHMNRSLIYELSERKFVIRQYQENVEYYKHNRTFDENTLRAAMKKIHGIRDKFWKCFSLEEVKERGIVIFGAGNMGQAIYKMLWNDKVAEYVVGFAVSDKENNISEMYDKPVFELADRDCCSNIVVLAVKMASGNYLDKSYYQTIFNINDMD